ncbi:hypothetical protein [Epilithonimonas sp. UC225_85]|uniref:hypothetical protein n=1 Tax=Epilithonimonas sp. UC225_85 TaxID=3350167 RepID=UPI0036D2E69E
MEALFEIIIRGLIINFLGVNTRYYFFKIFNKDLQKKDLENNKSDVLDSFGQGFYNFFVGLSVFSILSIGIAYLFYQMGML